MNYEMEELVPIVGKLAEKYTGHESTSITYEKAEQLMGAVVYCIHEAQGREGNLPAGQKKIPAQQMYEIGAAYVRDKAQKALRLYNDMGPDFESYENRCLYHTFVKELPEFFKRYDILFEPQNTILTLDYPVLKDLSGLEGIDKIYEFLVCVEQEQKFLNGFPRGYVSNILSGYSGQYRDMIENLCEIVLLEVMAHILAGKPLREKALDEGDYERIQRVFLERDIGEIEKEMKVKLERFSEEYYGDSRDLRDYLSGAVRGNLSRLKDKTKREVHGRDCMKDWREACP